MTFVEETMRDDDIYEHNRALEHLAGEIVKGIFWASMIALVLSIVCS